MIFFSTLGLLLSRTALLSGRKLLHREVRHSPRKKTFYIILDDYDRKAVLVYRIKGKIMDLYAINVPAIFKGRGLARLLTETAFTYAIVNNYSLFLTCSYAQKYYLANKSRGLKERVVGPKKILDLPVSLDPERFEELPDPEDSVSGNKKF